MSDKVQRPTSDEDGEGWKAYWKAQGMPWRTEPEIDEGWRRYLAERRSVIQDVERGIFAFRDEQGAIRLTRADVEWLLAAQPGGVGLDVRGADLRGQDLSHLPLAGLRGGLDALEYHQFGARGPLEAVHLEQASLQGAMLHRAAFYLAHLDGANLQGACLASAFLQEAHLAGANLEGAILPCAYLAGADVRGANLSYAHVEGADLRGTTLDDAYIAGALLHGADLHSATLHNARGCEVEPPFRRGPAGAAHLESAQLEGIVATHADLRWVHLHGAALGNAVLVEANLAHASLEGANLSSANLTSATLDGASLRGANFTRDEARQCQPRRRRRGRRDGHLTTSWAKPRCRVSSLFRLMCTLHPEVLRPVSTVRESLILGCVTSL
jgi:uncharacterized protein YjbI with pentapeptide repeats